MREIRLYDSLRGELVPVSAGDAIRVEVRTSPVVLDGGVDVASTRPLVLFSFLERFLRREGFATKFLFDSPGGGDVLYELSELEPLGEVDELEPLDEPLDEVDAPDTPHSSEAPDGSDALDSFGSSDWSDSSEALDSPHSHDWDSSGGSGGSGSSGGSGGSGRSGGSGGSGGEPGVGRGSELGAGRDADFDGRFAANSDADLNGGFGGEHAADLNGGSGSGHHAEADSEFDVEGDEEDGDDDEPDAGMSLLEVSRSDVDRWVNICFGATRDGIDDESASTGERILLSDALKHFGHPAVALYLLGTHYSLPLGDPLTGLTTGSKNASRIREALEKLVPNQPSPPDMRHHMEAFRDALANDLDTPLAFVVMFEWLLEAERRDDNVGDHDLRVMLEVLELDGLAASVG